MIEIRALATSDNRATFRSGDPDLDRFFLRYAGQNQFRHHLGVTYIAIEDERILAFATVAAAQIEATSLPTDVTASLPKYPLPVLRLARLAVSETAKGRGIGQMLVRFVFTLGHTMAAQVGCVGIAVDAKRGAEAFYEKLGFVRLQPISGELADRPLPISLFLPLPRH